MPITWHARSGGSEMKQDRHRVCCFVGKRGRGWGCLWERGSAYSHHGWALRRRADPCELAPLEQGAGQPRERGQSCCVPGIRAPGGELGPEPWSREGAAWGLGWGREKLLLLPCGKEHREEEGRRRAPRWFAASRGSEWREALGEKTVGWGSSAAGFSGRHAWELDCSSFTGAMDPGSCCAMARPSWEMQRARGRRGRGHRALAGREEEQAWAPWEEVGAGLGAPCAQGDSRGEKKLGHGCWRCSAREGAWRGSRLPWGRSGGGHGCWPSSLLATVRKKTGSVCTSAEGEERERWLWRLGVGSGKFFQLARGGLIFIDMG
jgi:hypothetical protein